MDEMRININTNFMKTLIGKFIKNTIQKKTGYDISVKIKELTADAADGKAHAHLCIDLDTNEETYNKILSKLL